MSNCTPLLGLVFDDISLDAAVDALLARPAGAPFAYVVTPNTDHLARLRRIPALAPVYRNAWFCLLDSQLLARLADALRMPRPQVVTGADLTQHLLDRLDGETASVIGMAAADFARLQNRYPLIYFTHYLPPMGLLHDQAAFILARNFGVAAQARFTFIALGAPVQELLAFAMLRHGGARGTALCIGAALEFAAQSKRRAPAWMQRAGLEWLHRLAANPARLAPRYLLDDPPVLLALLAAAWRERKQKNGLLF
jgi:N-acetylglucosaminyldiphosphoundecaprenol N-acetyl-beta-D-mannosaminyltransferase